jgi:hypothetical protein
VTEFLNHAITVGDLLVVSAVAVVFLIVFLGFVVLAVNMGWVK